MDTQKTQQHIEKILTLLGVSAQVNPTEHAGQHIFELHTEEGNILVGRGGEVVQALNYILKKIAEKEGTSTEFSVDVNGFRLHKIEELEQHAKLLAERARSLKYDVEMPPMSAYDRLIVHTVLQNEKDVKTESQGEGRDRRLIIKYVG
jgi:spoIIIJ-associated protein